MVYTYVGDIVVSVNPFKNTGCVGKGIRSKYKGASRRSLPPHIYALVDHAYNEMMRNNMSQSILISGESGAGKTEAMKICLTYIGEVSQTKGKRVSDEVAIRLMQTNPVMEALGNAKTIRNNNSSRFGKHFDVQFSANGVILGAFTSCYLLEKPRIVQHMTGERNYHVFYMLCKAPGPVKSVFNCTKWQDYKINNQKGTIETVETWNDNEEFEAMHEALLKLGFTEEQRDMVYTMFGICMHLGNIDFKPGKEGSEITNPKVLETAAGMLKVDAKILADAITFKTMGGGKLSTYKVPLEPRTAQAAKQSLIMHIYQLCFDWNVIVINDYISVYNAAVCTGVLDIFGFENFSLNSFPQLCINFTNESLHNLFIEHGARPSAAPTASTTSASTTASSSLTHHLLPSPPLLPPRSLQARAGGVRARGGRVELCRVRGQPARPRPDREAPRLHPRPVGRGLRHRVGEGLERARELPLDVHAGEVQGVHQAEEERRPHVRVVALRGRGDLHDRGVDREEQG